MHAPAESASHGAGMTGGRRTRGRRVAALAAVAGLIVALAAPAASASPRHPPLAAPSSSADARGHRAGTATPRAADAPGNGCAATPSKSKVTRTKSASEALSVDKVAELLRDGAIDYTELSSFDWILNLMGGGESTTDKKLDEIQRSIADANAELVHISDQITALCHQLENLAQELQTLADWSAFRKASADAQQDLDDMTNMVKKVTVIEQRTQDGQPVTSLSDTDAGTLADLRKQLTTTQWLYRLRNHVGGPNGVIDAYATVLENGMLHPQEGPDGTTPPVIVPPSTSHLYTAAYMQPMQQLLEYYSRGMEQGLSALSDLYHASFKDDGHAYEPDTLSTTTYVGDGLNAIDAWNQKAAGGITSIPDNTMVDENTKPYTMWTQSPVSVSADAKATAACVDAQVVCLNDDFANDGTVMNNALVAPTKASLADQIKANGYGGYTDWNVPTPDKYKTLLAEDGSAPTDIPTWALHHELGMFPVRSITSHTNGMGKPVKIIGPLLATQNGRPGSMSTTDPTKRLLGFHSLPIDGQNQTGGALVLERDAVPVKLCTATWCPKDRRKTATARFTAAQVPVGHTRPVTGTAPINQPTTYSSPTSCASGPTFTVDPNANAVVVTAVGAPGGSGKLDNKPDAPGGRGGTVSTVVPVPGGATLRVQVGAPGGDTVAGIGGGAKGGATVPASWPDTKKGDHSGGGGGASGVSSMDCTHWLVVGGGGGGGGSSFHSGGITAGGTWHGGRGGDACPLPEVTPHPACVAGHDGTDSYPDSKLGQPGGTPPDNAGGHNRDGTQLAGGDGSQMQGGNGSDGERKDGGDGGAGGGGGGGFYGGGGGGGGAIHAGGGGGGGGGDFAIPGVIANQTTYGFNATASGSVVLTSVQIDNDGHVIGQVHRLGLGKPPTRTTRPDKTALTADLAATGPPPATGWLVMIGTLAVIIGAGALAAGLRRRPRR